MTLLIILSVPSSAVFRSILVLIVSSSFEIGLLLFPEFL